MAYVTGMPYIGSKKKFVNVVNNQLDSNSVYIEPFSGGYSLGLSLKEIGFDGKRIYNDLGEGVFSFYYYALNNPDLLVFTYSKILSYCDMNALYYDNVYGFLKEKFTSDCDKAVLEYMRRVCSRGVLAEFISLPKLRGVGSFRSLVHKVNNFMGGVEVLNLSYTDLKKYDSSDTFWFIDPPYDGYDNVKYYGLASLGFCQEGLADFVTSLEGDFMLVVPDNDYMRELYKNMVIQDMSTYSLAGSKFIEEIVVSKNGVDLSLYPDTIIKADSSSKEEFNWDGVLTFGDFFK